MGTLRNFKRFQFQPFQSRIGDLQVRNFWMDEGTPKSFTGTDKSNFSHFEIVKWQPNPYYGKYDEYITNGYVESFGGDYLQKPGHSIDINFFKSPENCYALAYWINMDHDEMSPDLQFVGNRPVRLNKEEQQAFMELAELGQAHIEKELEEFYNDETDTI